MMSNCEVVTFPLLSWVKRGAYLYGFLIFAIFLTLVDFIYPCSAEPGFVLFLKNTVDPV